MFTRVFVRGDETFSWMAKPARAALRRARARRCAMPAPRDYVVVNGLRYVQPYFHTFDIRVSDKRVGSSVLAALDEQVRFQGRVGDGREHWARELASGRVRLASDVRRRLPTGGEIPEEWFAAPESLDAPVPPDSFFRVVRHVHEPCVGCEVPRVLLEDSKLVFVDKPAGVPTLAGCGPGLQGENNATRLLNRTRAENNAGADGELFAVNRIDKPVSGVWILAKGSRLAARCRAALAKPGHETKTYLARVRGAVNGTIRIDAPLSVGADGLATTSGGPNDSKPAVTLVHPVARYPPPRDDCVLVACRLERSGRFHQIRCHLASAGVPIANDATYRGVESGADDSTMDDSTNDSGGGRVGGGVGRPGFESGRGRDDGGGGTEVYADDDDGTLLASVTEPGVFTATCLECGWAAAAAAGDVRAFDPRLRASCAAEWCDRVASEDVKRRGNVKRRRREPDASRECEASAPRTGRRPRAGTSIDLHSAEYRIWFDGAEYAVRSEALPAFAMSALGADATIDTVVDALPWAGEGLEAAGRARRK